MASRPPGYPGTVQPKKNLVLETCTGIHDDTTKIYINDIFDSNPTNLKNNSKTTNENSRNIKKLN